MVLGERGRLERWVGLSTVDSAGRFTVACTVEFSVMVRMFYDCVFANEFCDRLCGFFRSDQR